MSYYTDKNLSIDMGLIRITVFLVCRYVFTNGHFCDQGGNLYILFLGE